MSDKAKASCGCEGNGKASNFNFAALPKTTDKLQILYFTDPICSYCWGVEPALRCLELHYGDQFPPITHMVAGILPKGATPPEGIDKMWDKGASLYGMPMSGRAWREDAPESSHPACMAVKAAFLQSHVQGERFLRRIREFVMLDGRNIAKWDVLADAAAMAGLDMDKFKQDFDSKGQEMLDTDMKIAKEFGVNEVPVIIFQKGDKAVAVAGVRDFRDYEKAILEVAPELEKKNLPNSVEDVFKYYDSLTIREIDELTHNLTTISSSSEINNLVNKKQAVKLTYPGGFLWRKLKK